jgi:hypothetical protein
MMNRDPRLLISIACNWLLYIILDQINAILGTWNIHLYVAGIFLLFPVFYMPVSYAYLSIAIAGFFMDSASPLPFGFHFIFLWFCATLIHAIRSHLYRENKTHIVIITITVNLLASLFICLVNLSPVLLTAHFWIRLGSDSLISSVFCYLFAYRYLEIQRVFTLSSGHELNEDTMEAVKRPFTPPRS